MSELERGTPSLGNCSNCGSPLHEGFQICPDCGHPAAGMGDLDEPPPTVLDTPREENDWLLAILTGEEQGAAFPVGEALVLGRGKECSVILADAKASRRHAQIERVAEGRYRIQDLGSSNGTFLQGERIETSEVVPGAQIRIGDTLMTLTPTAQTCANCGQPLEEGAQFCGNCGHPVGAPAEIDLEKLAAEIEARAGAQPEAMAAGAPAAAAPDPGATAIDAPKQRGSSRNRLIGIGCLVLTLLVAAAVCCGALYPLLEDL